MDIHALECSCRCVVIELGGCELGPKKGAKNGPLKNLITFFTNFIAIIITILSIIIILIIVCILSIIIIIIRFNITIYIFIINNNFTIFNPFNSF